MRSPHAEDATARAAGRLGTAALATVLLAVTSVPLALLVRGSWPPLLEADQAVTAAAEDAVAASPPLLALARAVTLLGDPALAWAAAGAVALVLGLRGRVRLAVFVLAVRAGTQLLSSGMKVAVDRSRPQFETPVDTALGASFPSGHTLAAAGLWSALAVLALPLVPPGRRWWLLAAGAGVAVLVGASRVLLGVHYVSDVVSGLLLGLGWTALCAALLVRWRADTGTRVRRVADAVDPPGGAP